MPDPVIEAETLLLAEQHILVGEQHIARQREIIKLLERTGGSADRAALLARDILATMQERVELSRGQLSRRRY